MSLGRYLANVSLAFLYAAAYLGCYTFFLNRHYEYVGFDLYPREKVFLALALIISILPIIFYRGTRAISSVISVLIYLILYVPIILTFALGSGRPLNEILVVQLTFLFGMCVLFMADLIVVRNPLRFDRGLGLMPVVLTLTVVSTLYVFAVYRGSLRLSSFGEELYEQRFANLELGAGLATRYLSTWLTTVLAPLCFGYGLTARKYWYIGAGAAACVILYMATANKIMILLPFVSLTFYLVAKTRLRTIYPVFAGGLALMIVALVAAAGFGGLVFLVSSLILFRTIGNGGQLTVAYYDFFGFHPQTHYSHVSGINFLTNPYPYGDLGVGQVVGEFYWSPLMNANAHFWATDGIAAMGLLGVAIASVGCALLFVVMNSVTREYNLLFVTLSFIPFMITLLNQSMFSSVWSGGAFFLVLFFLFNKRIAPLMKQQNGSVLQVRSG